MESVYCPNLKSFQMVFCEYQNKGYKMKYRHLQNYRKIKTFLKDRKICSYLDSLKISDWLLEKEENLNQFSWKLYDQIDTIDDSLLRTENEIKELYEQKEPYSDYHYEQSEYIWSGYDQFVNVLMDNVVSETDYNDRFCLIKDEGFVRYGV